MTDPRKPPTRRFERAAVIVVGIVLAMFILVFVGRNVWHGEELKQDQATGNNVATEHTGPNYNQRP